MCSALIIVLKKSSQKKNLKIITGLNNFNLSNIINVVSLSETVNATYLDVSASLLVVREVKNKFNWDLI